MGDATRLLAGLVVCWAPRVPRLLPGMVGTVGAGMAANPTAQLTSATGAGSWAACRVKAAAMRCSRPVRADWRRCWRHGSGCCQCCRERWQTPVQPAHATANGRADQPGAATRRDGLQPSARACPPISARADAGRLTRRAGVGPAAVRRPAEFQIIGATPTRGMVTQDPVRITGNEPCQDGGQCWG